MAKVVDEAYNIQASPKNAEVARVGIWGNNSDGNPESAWDFVLEKDHKLKMITIDHGDLIYSLMFTTELNGIRYTSDKAGGSHGGDTITQKTFEDDEELIGINGTVGAFPTGNTVISSLTFITNKTIRGPFGVETDTPFSVPWEQGSFGGFYGMAGRYIDGIGVYVKASSDGIARVGWWGTQSIGSPQNQWSFKLEKDHNLKKISIGHGDLIFSLVFTTEFRGQEIHSKTVGDSSGGVVSEVTFASDEELLGINGSVGVSKGTYAGYTIISSLSFITNKKTHGPFGHVTTRSFNVPWNKGSFAGFYGRAGGFLDAIGVYLKAAI